MTAGPTMPVRQVTGHRPGLSMAALARWVNLALVIALGASIAQMVWLFVPAGAEIPEIAIEWQGQPGRAAQAPGLEILVPLELFGRPPVVAVEVPQDAPETRLDLTLRGVFATGLRENAWAIIAVSGGAERHYRIGDRVGGATVRDILPDRVVLEHGGRFEALRLPRDRLAAEGSRPAQAASARAAPAVDSIGQLGALRDRLASDPREIARVVDVRPAMRDGTLYGYTLRPRRHQDLFRAAGLQPDDVVVAVNGIPVVETAQLGELMAVLQTAGTLALTVERPDGGRQEIHIDMQN